MASYLFLSDDREDNRQSLQIGWKPAPTQPQPLERGTGKVPLGEAL
jgi:hypothetical protein